MENKNIYKGLECHCNEFERIPIHRRELGIAGNVATYGVAIGESYTIYKLDKFLENEKISKSIGVIPKISIKVNAGILSFLQGKIEGKSNERVAMEMGVGFVSGLATDYLATQNTYGKALIQKGTNLAQQTLSQTSKLASSGATRLAASKIASNTATKVGISLLTRIATGAAAGATAGSVAPIVGTIIGAVAGALIAGVVNDIIFAEEDKALAEAKAENERIKQREIQYQNKINRINDYLIRNHYIELRELDKDKYGNPIPNSKEAEELCKEASNLKSSYFKTILLMLSFPNYLDKDKAFYDDLEQKETNASKESNNTESKGLTIKPIADAISITLEIEKCYDESNMNKAHTDKLLINKTIYVYNKRFKRVVAKTQTDENGKAVFTEVFVGKEHTIDELRFMVDRDNLSERVA